jgi:hypothetical protein
VNLTQLHDGIEVPEYATRVPWLVTKPQLREYLPAGALSESRGWPLLRFTLLGVNATFGFNFIWHPESRLLAVGFDAPTGADIDAVFAANATALRSRLGEPNTVNHPDSHHLMWRDERVWVNYSAGVPEQANRVRNHRLSVNFHAGMPRAWVPANERTLAEVKRLLNLMPGVEVVEIHFNPAGTTISLSIGSPRSLARLAHLPHCVNFVMSVGIDHYHEANGELSASAPAGILYRMLIDGPREPEPDGFSTKLQILGIYLAADLRDLGILTEGEADRLSVLFNNNEDGINDT